jgi:hypothetical protein
MLRVAAGYWDPTLHVFHFNQCELYPMIEEFATLMNHTDLRYILLPPKHKRALDILDECLGILYSLGRTWLKKGFNLRALVEYFRDRRDNEHYHRALVVAVLAGFFLVGDFEAIEPNIIDITTMLGTNNLVIMILIETLNGLDDLKDDTCYYFKGSPLLLQVKYHTFLFLLLLVLTPLQNIHHFLLLLQMWLYDHWKLLSTPRATFSVYERRNFRHRKLTEKAPREFTLLLEEVNHEKINWVLPWWRLDTFITRTYVSGYVVMAGLERTSFYCPGHLKR